MVLWSEAFTHHLKASCRFKGESLKNCLSSDRKLPLNKYAHFKIMQRFVVGKGFELKAFLDGNLLDSTVNLDAQTWENITVYMGLPRLQEAIDGFIKNFDYTNYDEGNNKMIIFDFSIF